VRTAWAVRVYENARLVGTLTERDVVTAVANGVPGTALAARVMTPEPVCAGLARTRPKSRSG
jgi:CBS domain-containing protein